MAKPIVLWGHKTGPNSWKVAMVLEELEIPYEHKFLDFAKMKQEPYESLNPNGRIPTIEDPNTGLVIWESAACIDYLCETYDKTGKITPTDAKTKWVARSWRDLQNSGQGPSFGQYGWFMYYHPEKLPSAIERYKNEVIRITSVLDRQLSKTDFLAGDQMTYADFMFLPWFLMAFKIPDVNFKEQFPSWATWWKKMHVQPAVAKIWSEWVDSRKAEGMVDE